MRDKIILMIASMIVERLSGDALKSWADMGLDMLEDTIENTPSQVDDKLALPVIKAIREGFDIEDND